MKRSLSCLLLPALLLSSSAFADEDVSSKIWIADSSENTLVLETDLEELVKLDLYDFRNGSLKPGISIDAELRIECFIRFGLVEYNLVPPDITFDEYGRIIVLRPGFCEEVVNECVDGEWQTTVTIVDMDYCR